MNKNKKKQSAQFARIESHALIVTSSKPRNPPKDWKPKSTVSGVCGEAERLETHVGHLAHQEGYQADFDVVYGIAPTLLSFQISNRAKEMKSNGERLKSDQCVMCSGVFSYPETECDENFFSWLADSMEYLKDKYGDKLKSVVVHYDESYPHLHFFLADMKTLSVGELDPIRIARKKEEQKKIDTGKNDAGDYIYKPKMSAQKEALSEWLDDYYLKVSSKYDHAREVGARKARFHGTPRQVKHTLALADKERKLNEEKANLLAQRDKLTALATELAIKSMENQKKTNLLFDLMDQMNEEVKRLHKNKEVKEAVNLSNKIRNIRSAAFGGAVAPSKMLI